MRKCAVDGRMYRSFAEITFSQLGEYTAEELDQELSTKVTGSPLMTDLRVTAVDTKWNDTELVVIVEVAGDVTPVVAAVREAQGL